MKKLVVLAMLICVAFTSNAKRFSYARSWSDLRELESEGLYGRAFDKCDTILNQAISDKKDEMIVKALMEQLRFANYMEEEAHVFAIQKMDSISYGVPSPAKEILHSLLAETYWSYYQNNQYRISERSYVDEMDLVDFRTWSLDRIAQQIVHHYLQSLSNPHITQLIPITDYNAFIMNTESAGHHRPSMFDFLAHRALDFAKYNDFQTSGGSHNFNLNNDDLWISNKSFEKLDLETNDTLNTKYFAMKIYQALIKFHQDLENDEPLFHLEKQRLEFLRSYSTLTNKEEKYKSAIERLAWASRYERYAGEAWAEYARILKYEGDQYYSTGDSTVRWNQHAALLVCERVHDHFKNSMGDDLCLEIKSQILTHELSIRTQEAVAVNKHSVAMISFKNVDEVYMKIIKYDADDFTKAQEKFRAKTDEYLSFDDYLRMKKGKHYQKVDLLNPGDHHNHNVEMLIPELKNGHYYVVIGTDEKFLKKESGFAYSPLWVTDLSYQSRTRDGKVDILVSDRTSGKPLSGVKVELTYTEYDYSYGRSVLRSAGTYTTGENGLITASAGPYYRNYDIRLQKGDEEYDPSSSIYMPYRSNYYEDTHVQLYTDRTIYRPGQTVHFKGIALRDKGKQKVLLPNFSTTVRLSDPNWQEVDKLDLRTNEFGSIAGSFEIPEDVRTGQFRLHTYYGTLYFSVEEYKRPKFTASMDPIEGEYNVWDLIKTSGIAEGYAGNKLDGATVEWKITRSAAYTRTNYYWSSSWLYPSYYSSYDDLASGTTTTNSDGEFEINFVAIPDRNADPHQLPHFTYTITADVTDINGETHSTSSSVVVGYESMTLTSNIWGNVDKDEVYDLWIQTRNLNYQDVGAKGELKFIKLEGPDEAYSPRPLGTPDIERWDEKEFHKIFPEYLYQDENNQYSWDEKDVVFKMAFDTDIEDSVEIDMSSWEPGVYKYVATAKDKNGIELEDEKIITVYDKDAEKGPSNELFWVVYTSEEFEIGDTAEIVLATKNEDLLVRMEQEVQNVLTVQETMEMSDEQRVIRIPIEEKHKGNFTVHLSAVKNNNSVNQSVTVSVPYADKNLDLEFSTFRDKLLPGQDEEWTLTVKNRDGEKEDAELMATLYDASLDQLRSPNSYYLSVYDYYYSQLYWSALSGIGSAYGGTSHGEWNEYYYADRYYYPYMDSYASYNYSGFSGFGGGFDRGYLRQQVNNQIAPMESYDMAEMEIAYDEIAMEETEGGEYYSWNFSGDGDDSKDKMAKLESTTASGSTYEFSHDLAADSNMPVTGGLPASYSANFKRGRGDYMSLDGRLANVEARTNFSETAFFYPQLRTNEDGEIQISFKVPESVTKWKFMGMAHTRDLKIGYLTKEVVTQKPLMVIPNPPRFLREGDKITIAAKIANVSEEDQEGKILLELIDPFTDKKIGKRFELKGTKKDFKVKAGGSVMKNWTISIPDNVPTVKYRIVAASETFEDGEANVLPILSNRMLVTESLPMPIRGNETKSFNFKKLKESAKSNSLKHHRFTLEFTSNPAWYALQSTPYMMEYPYECTEQTFTRMYSNVIAAHIMNSNPKVRDIVDRWRDESPEAFLSNLQKNEELKAIVLEETPWVLDAKSEEQSKKNLAVLLDMNRMMRESNRAIDKIMEAQTPSGGFTWFPGMEPSPYITRHIVCGFGHLNKMGVGDERNSYRVWGMIVRAIEYMDKEMYKDYLYAKKWDDLYWKHKHIGYDNVHYLYARSFFPDIPFNAATEKAHNYYKRQSRKYWKSFNNYAQGMIALTAHRNGMEKLADQVTASLKDRAITDDEMGMYWKDNTMGYYWYQAPVETQALMIEMFNEVKDDQETVDELKIWLLKQKQTNSWATTKQTSEAVYALLLTGSDLLANDDLVDITLGDQSISYVSTATSNPYEVVPEAGTGYFKTHWVGNQVEADMGDITVAKKSSGIAWGAAYWQYFEDLDKITYAKTNISLKKDLFLVTDDVDGEKITPVKNKELNVGDLVRCRVELRSDRDLEFVHMKDHRASGFEPTDVLSTYRYQDGLGYYQSTRDAATHFFFDRIPKGTYVFEYDMRIAQKGDFSNGIATLQCMYAPEFTSHSNGLRVQVK